MPTTGLNIHERNEPTRYLEQDCRENVFVAETNLTENKCRLNTQKSRFPKTTNQNINGAALQDRKKTSFSQYKAETEAHRTEFFTEIAPSGTKLTNLRRDVLKLNLSNLESWVRTHSPPHSSRTPRFPSKQMINLHIRENTLRKLTPCKARQKSISMLDMQ